MNKFVYPSKLEQNVNFVYTKLGDISLKWERRGKNGKGNNISKN